VDHTSRMNVFQSTLGTCFSCSPRSQHRRITFAYHNLIQEVLDELLLERSGREKSVQIGPEEFSDEVAVLSQLEPARDPACTPKFYSHILKGRNEDVAERDNLQRNVSRSC
jgi:hypothetical protein